MNKRYLSIVAVLAGAVSWFALQNAEKTQYQPRVDDVMPEMLPAKELTQKHIMELNMNVNTGKVDGQDYLNAKAEAKAMRSLGKASFPIQWEPAGPDNRGGRTRAILVDNKDANILYAGGVAGGLFKSTNKGASWTPIGDDWESMTISSMTQTSSGDIYVGTGELAPFGLGGNGENYTPGFPGSGIYKSTDGESFEKLATTNGFTYVGRLVSHPSDNIVYAATNLGLRYSNDGGQTWTSLRPGLCDDVAIDKNGNVLAVIADRLYRSSTPLVGTSYKIVEGLPNSGRIVISYAPSDPSFAYAMCTGNVTIEAPSGNLTIGDGLIGVYQSKDNGATFSQIIGKENVYFNLMTHISLGKGQGIYNSCIGVHPTNPERIFMGGINFAEWTPQLGARIVGNTGDFPTNRKGIHADKHQIIFDTQSEPMVMYIAHDGGVSKTTNASMDNYTGISNGYQTMQFFGCDVSPSGVILGGSQDQSTVIIDGKGSTPLAGVEVLGGDGGRVEISDINSDVVFGQLPRGFMFRSLNSGTGWSPIWDSRVNDVFVDPDDPDSDSDPVVPASFFNGAIRLWENPETGENRLFYSMDRSVWMVDDVINEPNPIWYRILNTNSNAQQIEVSKDGNTVFIGIGGALHRISGMNDVQWDTVGPLADHKVIPAELTTTRIDSRFPSSYMSDIEIDYSNVDRAIVTFAGYGANHVFQTLDLNSADPTFTIIDGALPDMPIFAAEISQENPAHIILGTQLGMWTTENGTAKTPTWSENNDGFGNVPVYELKQTEIIRDSWRSGPTMYAATHGRGIYKSSSLLTSVRKSEKEVFDMTAFPNPSTGQFTLGFTSNANDRITVRVVDIQGKEVYQRSVEVYGKKAHSIEIDLESLSIGTYFVNLSGDNHKGATRVIKSH